MILAKVVGSAVATIKDDHLTGVKLLVVQPLTKMMTAAGSLKVAADAALKAGPGDVVILVRSRDAAMALEVTGAAVDLAVVGVVDAVHVAEAGLSYTLADGYTQFER